MFLLTRPTPAEIKAFVESLKDDSFSYPEVGASRDSAPPRYSVDHNRILLGSGEEAFERTKQAVREWRMFEVPGLELFYRDTPIAVGRNVAPLARHIGFYSLNSCRIAYVIDEPGRFGFAYGTLTEHAEIGEERFTVEFDPATGEVWYDVFAFSRPGHSLVRLGYFYARFRQKSFAQASKAAMKRAVLHLPG